MIYFKRLLIVVLSTALLLALRTASDSWLDHIFEQRLHWRGSGKLAEVALCLLAIMVVFSAPGLRRDTKISLRPTWLLLATLPFVAVNVGFWHKPPAEQILLSSLSLALGAMAAGINEELFMRGFAFAGGGEATPRFTVAVTASIFGLIHFFNLTSGAPLVSVVGTVILAAQMGLIFGLIRIATGSIFWCVLVHAIVNSTFEFTNPDAELYGPLAFISVILTFIAGIVLLFIHPMMRCQGSKESARTFPSPQKNSDILPPTA